MGRKYYGRTTFLGRRAKYALVSVVVIAVAALVSEPSHETIREWYGKAKKAVVTAFEDVTGSGKKSAWEEITSAVSAGASYLQSEEDAEAQERAWRAGKARKKGGEKDGEHSLVSNDAAADVGAASTGEVAAAADVRNAATGFGAAVTGAGDAAIGAGLASADAGNGAIGSGREGQAASKAEGKRSLKSRASTSARRNAAASGRSLVKGAGRTGQEGLEVPAVLTDRWETLLKRHGYTCSYNQELGIPNWVAWELTKDRLVERESRTNEFLTDPDLPEAIAVTTDDYKGSGYDRGHMCPAADNRYSYRAMYESFYMTNICPQNNKLNRGDWAELEIDCRRWVREKGTLYIVCGPILYKGKHKTIGREHTVTVPEAFFKVILCMETTPPQAIGFIYKNESCNKPLSSYVNTVDEVERITGIDFFAGLPDEVETVVERECDLSLWQRGDW